MPNKILFITFSTLLVLLNAKSEPSAFELQSGATKRDLQNIQSANKNLESIAIDYNSRIQNLEQTQDGLRSVVDGQSLRLKNLIDSSNKEIEELKTTQGNLENKIIQLEKEIKANQQTIDNLNSQIIKLTKLTESLSKDILKELESKPESKPESKNEAKQTNLSSFKNVNKKEEAFSKAKQFYKNKEYNNAKDLYLWLVENNYKKAHSLYMLGEISYMQGKFKEAINFFKQSATLDDKASYMPILLWHTAWSFKYSKDLTNYNKFLDSLIRLYPESDQGKKAKNLKNKEK